MSGIKTLAEMERELIFKAAERCEYHSGRTARVLGISDRTLRHKMNEYGENSFFRRMQKEKRPSWMGIKKEKIKKEKKTLFILFTCNLCKRTVSLSAGQAREVRASKRAVYCKFHRRDK